MAAPRLHRLPLRRTASSAAASCTAAGPHAGSDPTDLQPSAGAHHAMAAPRPTTTSSAGLPPPPPPPPDRILPPPTGQRRCSPRHGRPSRLVAPPVHHRALPSVRRLFRPTGRRRYDVSWARFRCCYPRSSRNSTIGLGAPPSSAPSLQVQLGRKPSALWPPAPLLCATAVIVGQEPGFIHVFPRSLMIDPSLPLPTISTSN